MSAEVETKGTEAARENAEAERMEEARLAAAKAARRAESEKLEKRRSSSWPDEGSKDSKNGRTRPVDLQRKKNSRGRDWQRRQRGRRLNLRRGNERDLSVTDS